MSISPLDDLQTAIKRFNFSFIGFTVQPHIYSFIKRHQKLKSNLFGSYSDLMPDPFPIYCVSNQPCEIVQWTSRKLMMSFVKRKDKEQMEAMKKV